MYSLNVSQEREIIACQMVAQESKPEMDRLSKISS